MSLKWRDQNSTALLRYTRLPSWKTHRDNVQDKCVCCYTRELTNAYMHMYDRLGWLAGVFQWSLADLWVPTLFTFDVLGCGEKEECHLHQNGNLEKHMLKDKWCYTLLKEKENVTYWYSIRSDSWKQQRRRLRLTSTCLQLDARCRHTMCD